MTAAPTDEGDHEVELELEALSSTTDDGQVATVLEYLCDRISKLEACVKTLEAETDRLESTVEAQADRIDAQAEQLDRLNEETSTLKESQEESQEHRKHLQGRLHALERSDGKTDTESRSDIADTPGETDTDTQTARTPLEQLVTLSARKLREHVSVNQRRAVAIARNVCEYADRVPAGFTIDSGTIRTILKAREDTTPHTQTVSRVMSFLDRLGKEHVRTVTRRGTKRVVLTETAVERLQERTPARDRDQDNTDMESTAEAITGVVIGEPVGGV